MRTTWTWYLDKLPKIKLIERRESDQTAIFVMPMSLAMEIPWRMAVSSTSKISEVYNKLITQNNITTTRRIGMIFFKKKKKTRIGMIEKNKICKPLSHFFRKQQELVFVIIPSLHGRCCTTIFNNRNLNLEFSTYSS